MGAHKSTMGEAPALPRVILFGDSLTQYAFEDYDNGFGTALQRYYTGTAEVLNKGIAGFNSKLLLPEFDKIVNEINDGPNIAQPILFTIFIGANDACLPPVWAHVPLDQFEANIRHYVETILTSPAMEEARIVLITPPPINISAPMPESIEMSPAVEKAFAEQARKQKGYRTYMSKKRYAHKIMEIAQSFREGPDRVVGLNLWRELVEDHFRHEGLSAEEIAEAIEDENRQPGSGLPSAKEFRSDTFTDGLHFGKEGYAVLTNALMELVFRTWPELQTNRL